MWLISVCKKLSHLKCAVNERPVAARTRSKLKSPEQKQFITRRTRDTQLVRDDNHSQAATADRDGLTSVLDKENFHVEETESLTEFIIEVQIYTTDQDPVVRSSIKFNHGLSVNQRLNS